MTAKEAFAMILNHIKFNQRNLGIKKSMTEFEITVAELATVFSTDKQETKAALEALTQIGMLNKRIAEKTTAPVTKYDAKRFTARSIKQAEYSLTKRAAEYVNSLRTA